MVVLLEIKLKNKTMTRSSMNFPKFELICLPCGRGNCGVKTQTSEY